MFIGTENLVCIVNLKTRRVKMTENITEIACVIDRSGSMASIRNDAIGGFNTFLEDQKKLPDKAKTTVVLFDDEYLLLHNGVDLENVKPLTEKTYVPRGTTALYDAIGRTISAIDARVSGTTDQKVILAILTDGQENASREFKKSKIIEMIQSREKMGWCILYLSASASAFADASMIGVSSNNTMSFVPDSKGMHKAYSTMSASFSDYRSSTSSKRYGR
jgi:uncharacterized protein YegL